MPKVIEFSVLVSTNPKLARSRLIAMLTGFGMRRDLTYKALGTRSAGVFATWVSQLKIDLEEMDEKAEREGWKAPHPCGCGVKGRSGRPKGSTDKYQRSRRTKEEIEEANANAG